MSYAYDIMMSPWLQFPLKLKLSMQLHMYMYRLRMRRAHVRDVPTRRCSWAGRRAPWLHAALA